MINNIKTNIIKAIFSILLLFTITPALSVELVTYYHNDFLGSPKAATNDFGKVIWTEDYLPYGSQVQNNASRHNKIGYAGEQFERDTGLTYIKSRHYNPDIGRFMQVDPAGFRLNNLQSINTYAYANNNPYRYKDPNGESPIDVIFFTIDAVKFGLAVKSGDPELIRQASLDLADSTVGLISPVPGTGILLKAKRLGKTTSAIGDATKKTERGVIYRVAGDKTDSGKPYIGSANDLEKRAKTARDGRDRTDAEVIGSFPIGDRKARRKAEQQAIIDNGGVRNLDNKRNEIAPSKWKEYGIELF